MFKPSRIQSVLPTASVNMFCGATSSCITVAVIAFKLCAVRILECMMSIALGDLDRAFSASEMVASHRSMDSGGAASDSILNDCRASEMFSIARRYLPMTAVTALFVNGQNYLSNCKGIPMCCIFFQLLSFIWSSRISVRWDRDAVRVAAETELSTDHNVSNTSPSTTPAPGT